MSREAQPPLVGKAGAARRLRPTLGTLEGCATHQTDPLASALQNTCGCAMHAGSDSHSRPLLLSMLGRPQQRRMMLPAARVKLSSGATKGLRKVRLVTGRTLLIPAAAERRRC